VLELRIMPDRIKWQQFTLWGFYYYRYTIIWLVWFVAYQCWEDIDVIGEFICENIEEVTFCAEIYILYTYNLIKKDIDISEYQTRY
jgi:hypothetical protein